MHKRKHRSPAPAQDHRETILGLPRLCLSTDDTSHEFDPSLYIVAHEADIVCGARAVAAALALECPEVHLNGADKTGLVRWEPHPSFDAVEGDGDVDVHESRQPCCWVDRYDVRLLLESLPSHNTACPPPQPAAQPAVAGGYVAPGPRPLSPSGWTDLPSDAEDTFFLSPEETEDYRRDKRRRLIDRSREERLRALAAASGKGAEGEPQDEWGGSDEEPDDAQKELLRRTAAHIISSPNPAQLEMRILANHGADKRFSFLRGRWKRAWMIAKQTARQQQEEEEARKLKQSAGTSSLQGLARYGDSDESGNEPEIVDQEVEEKPSGLDAETRGHDIIDEEARKKARRERAREWAARHRAGQVSHKRDG